MAYCAYHANLGKYLNLIKFLTLRHKKTGILFHTFALSKVFALLIPKNQYSLSFSFDNFPFVIIKTKHFAHQLYYLKSRFFLWRSAKYDEHTLVRKFLHLVYITGHADNWPNA